MRHNQFLKRNVNKNHSTVVDANFREILVAILRLLFVKRFNRFKRQENGCQLSLTIGNPIYFDHCECANKDPYCSSFSAS